MLYKNSTNLDKQCPFKESLNVEMEKKKKKLQSSTSLFLKMRIEAKSLWVMCYIMHLVGALIAFHFIMTSQETQ